MNLLVTLAAIIGGFCALLGVPTLFILVRQSMRESRELRDKPLLDRLREMTDDRNYWREKADNLESRMQGRD